MVLLHPAPELTEVPPLRILYLTTEYPGLTNAGGIGTYTATISKGLAGLGHDVEVLLCAARLQSRDLDQDGTMVHVRPLVPSPWQRLAEVLSFFVEYRRLRRRFDVIQAPEFRAPALLLPASRRTALVVRLSTPTVVMFESTAKPVDTRVVLADRLERWTVKRANAIVAPSPMLVQRLREQAWLGDEPVTIVPTPVDVEMWSGLQPVDRTGPVILAVGRVDHNKGPDLVIEAAAKLIPLVPGMRVIFVGRSSGTVDGRPFLETVAARAAELGVPCTFSGERSASELRQFYDQARVVVIASRHDNWSNVGLEALAAGRPLVASAGAGISDLVRRLDPAGAVPAADPDRLAEALLRYLVDPTLAAAVGREGQRLVASEFAPARVAKQWEHVYHEVVARSRHL
jgi:glycogen(starch) synthase